MPGRIHLDVVERDGERIWFTLVVDAPVGFHVEQCHEQKGLSYSICTRHIEPDEMARVWVNDRPLISLVKKKFQEMAERSQAQPQAA